MNKTLKVSLDQIVPFSQARANLASLINKLEKKKYVVISKKYRPAAALVDLKFLNKILKAYYQWRTEQAFKVLNEVRAKNIDKTEKEVERDVAEAITAYRAEN